MATSTLNKITISKSEYQRLKDAEKRFKKDLGYLEHLIDIREARNEVKRGHLADQDRLFKKLGI